MSREPIEEYHAHRIQSHVINWASPTHVYHALQENIRHPRIVARHVDHAGPPLDGADSINNKSVSERQQNPPP